MILCSNDRDQYREVRKWHFHFQKFVCAQALGGKGRLRNFFVSHYDKTKVCFALAFEHTELTAIIFHARKLKPWNQAIIFISIDRWNFHHHNQHQQNRGNNNLLTMWHMTQQQARQAKQAAKHTSFQWRKNRQDSSTALTDCANNSQSTAELLLISLKEVILIF